MLLVVVQGCVGAGNGQTAVKQFMPFVGRKPQRGENVALRRVGGEFDGRLR